jgi:hypothetical protein
MLLLTALAHRVASQEQVGVGNTRTNDFAERCAGAFFCQGFDKPVGTKHEEWLGIGAGALDNARNRLPTIQNGLLHFEMLSGQDAGGAGYYYMDFAKRLGIKIGPGESIFVQWRQYMPSSFVTTMFQNKQSGPTHPKQIILSQDGETSNESACSPNEVVVVSQNMRGVPGRRFPSMYSQCGDTNLVELPGPKPKLFDRQPIGNSKPSVARQCWRGNIDACWEQSPDKWATYQMGLTIAPTSYLDRRGHALWDCHVQFWAKTDGNPGELVIDAIEPIRHVSLKWGRIWLLPYITRKDPAQVHPDTYTDYDELILSRSRIPDPR